MGAFSRRDVLRQLGMMAAVGSLPHIGIAKHKDERVLRSQPITKDFYVVFSGAWLFSFKSNNVTAISTNCSDHKYQYGDSSDGTVNLQTIPLNSQYSVQVSGNSLPKHGRDLVQKMIDNNQGIFFNEQVELPPSLPSGLRQISLSMPSTIEPAALFHATRGGGLVSVDNTNTVAHPVNYMPGAVVFIYSGWKTASFNAASSTSFDSSSGGVHLMMRVCPSATCDQPIPCDQNYPIAVTQQEQHATKVFGDLLDLLQFDAGSKPVLAFPPCIKHDTGVAVDAGSDGTLSLFEIGMFTDPCAKDGGKIGTLHTCAAAGLFVGF